jgi:hypothetical protein
VDEDVDEADIEEVTEVISITEIRTKLDRRRNIRHKNS